MPSLWRIATDTPDYEATDLGGRGAEATGGRWNKKGSRVVYTSTTRALACLETLAHLNSGRLPLNRYLVEVVVPADLWKKAPTLRAPPVGWDAIPEGRASITCGQDWLHAKASALLFVPSAIVAEEYNALINPDHPDAKRITARKVRRWLYDGRFAVGVTPPY